MFFLSCCSSVQSTRFIRMIIGNTQQKLRILIRSMRSLKSRSLKTKRFLFVGSLLQIEGDDKSKALRGTKSRRHLRGTRMFVLQTLTLKKRLLEASPTIPVRVAGQLFDTLMPKLVRAASPTLRRRKRRCAKNWARWIT